MAALPSVAVNVPLTRPMGSLTVMLNVVAVTVPPSPSLMLKRVVKLSLPAVGV